MNMEKFKENTVFEAVENKYISAFPWSTVLVENPVQAKSWRYFSLDDPTIIGLFEEYPEGKWVPYSVAKQRFSTTAIDTSGMPEFYDAFIYINNLDSPLEKLCINQSGQKKRDIVRKLHKFLITLETFVFIIGISISIGFHLDGIFIFGILLLIIILRVISFTISRINSWLSYSSASPRFTSDFQQFVDILSKYKFESIKGFEYFSMYGYRTNITYDLFNRVKTFALDSFLAADVLEDEKALVKIISPMVSDILDESEFTYQKYLKNEKDFEKLKQQELETQINTDLDIYKNRMFKNEGKKK